MYLILNNYDSFVFNLADYIHQLGYQTHIVYQDQITIAEIIHLNPKGIFISPGPKHPKDIPNVINIIRYFQGIYPIFGICLGHQAIGYAYGATISQTKPAHGIATQIMHTQSNIFKNIPLPLSVARYHALSIQRDSYIPECLQITAHTNDSENIIMAIKHKEFPIYGVQFHPESIITEKGINIIENFLYV